MDDGSKDELLAFCEKLKKKLSRYETRFSALVEAYKHLVEEKQILEKTLKTLSSKPQQNIYKVNDSKDSPKDDKADTEVVSDPLGVFKQKLDTSDMSCFGENGDVGEQVNTDKSTNISQDDIVRSFGEKISALSTALQSVTEGKAKMEAAFQADKKAMLMEHKMQILKAEEEKSQSLKQEQDMKMKLCQEQSEREAEQTVHSSMLKELHNILATERLEKDEVKTQLQERGSVMSGESRKLSLEYEDKIHELIEELQLVKLRLRKSELESEKPNKVIKGLTNEVEKIKLEHAKDVITEQRRANQAEELLKDRQEEEEKRISELEARLSELSEIVGNYDRLRQEDQLIIRKLRERLGNLNTENAVLATTDTSNNENEIAELREQVGKLKNLLKMTWKKPKFDLNLLSNSEIDDILKNDPAHNGCQAEYSHLKEEFENYKRLYKLNKVPKGNKDDNLSEQISTYKNKIERLQTDFKSLEGYYNETETDNLNTIATLQINITNIKEEHDRKMEDKKEEHKKHLEKVENELQKQRSRTMNLLTEKDTEIERLQNRLFDQDDFLIISKSMDKDKVGKSSENPANADEKSMVEEILVSSPTGSSSGGLFHFTQQIAHNESELSSYRTQIIDLQSEIRDSEHREEQVFHQMHALKEEIRKLERNRTRESANLEYLKNICLQYMLTDSYSVKQQMSLAIATILTFSPAEMAQVRKRQNSGWW